MFYLSSELVEHSKKYCLLNYVQLHINTYGYEWDLHSLFIELIWDVLWHVPDVAHAVRHQVHGVILSLQHLLLLLQLHNVLPVGGVGCAGQAGVFVWAGAGVLCGGTWLNGIIFRMTQMFDINTSPRTWLATLSRFPLLWFVSLSFILLTSSLVDSMKPFLIANSAPSIRNLVGFFSTIFDIIVNNEWNRI